MTDDLIARALVYVRLTPDARTWTDGIVLRPCFQDPNKLWVQCEPRRADGGHAYMIPRSRVMRRSDGQ